MAGAARPVVRPPATPAEEANNDSKQQGNQRSHRPTVVGRFCDRAHVPTQTGRYGWSKQHWLNTGTKGADMRVVVATNGQPAARAAQSLLASIADPEAVEILLLCVGTVEFVIPDGPWVKGVPPVTSSEPEQLLEEAAGWFRNQGFGVRTFFASGVPADEIMELAEREEAGLIVAGAGDQSWAGRVLWGGTATKLLHRSSTSVLVVQRAPSDDDLKVLVATDGSDHSERAVDFLGEFARRDRCRVQVVSVAEPAPTPVAEVLGGYISVPVTQEQIDDLRALAEAIAGLGAERLTQAGFETSTTIAVGYPARRILEVCEDGGSDLVVLGARGLGRVARYALGSVSDRVVRQAPASLVVRLAEEPGDSPAG